MLGRIWVSERCIGLKIVSWISDLISTFAIMASVQHVISATASSSLPALNQSAFTFVAGAVIFQVHENLAVTAAKFVAGPRPSA